MVLETEIHDKNVIIQGDLTVLISDNPDNGNGTVSIHGDLNTDKIYSNTIDGHISVEQVYFNNGRMLLSNIASPVIDSTDTTFFMNNTNSLLCSLDTLGVLTTYQPSNINGDIVVHNGTTQIRFPSGKHEQYIGINTLSDSRLKWKTTPLKSITMVSFNKNIIIDYPTGSFFVNIYPETENGGACNLLVSKGISSEYGVYCRLSESQSTISIKQINCEWNPYTGIQVYKNYIEGDGEYKMNSSLFFDTDIQTLNNTTSTQINNSTTGCFFYSIRYSEDNNTTNNIISSRPSCIIICLKGKTADTNGLFVKLNNIKGPMLTALEDCNLKAEWPANSGLLLSKTTNDYSGDYIITDNFQNDLFTVDISLVGTNPTIIPSNIFNFYEKKSFFAKVYSAVINSPVSFFSISKNNHNTNHSIFSSNIKGSSTLEKLNLTWNSNSLLQLSKTGNNYNGIYTIVFTRIQ